MNLFDWLPNVENNEKYVLTLKEKYTNFICQSELPIVYRDYVIDETKTMPKNIKLFYDNILDIINNRYSYIFVVDSYDFVNKLMNCIFNKYFNESIKNDTEVNNVLLINTKLFMQDFSKIAGALNNEVTPVLTYSNETLYQNIYKFPMIFWNNLHEINTENEMKRFNNIVQARFVKAMGNIYFVKQNIKNIVTFSPEVITNMNVYGIVDMTHLPQDFIKSEEVIY